MTSRISQLTRRDIVDSISIEGIDWSGRLGEIEFLARIFNLEQLPSFDPRHKDAAGDIFQHRILNPNDWDDSWIFYDSRFNIFHADDDLFLQFLCETVHPVVRSDTTEAERLVQLYNQFLRADGYEIVEKSKISGRPIFVARFVGIAQTPGINVANDTLSGTDWSYVSQQITRMETAVSNDPGLAIGTAKELIETCCKSILQERNVQPDKPNDINNLVKTTAKLLQLTPEDISEAAKAANTIKILLNNLATITQGIAELRNRYGTGHGPEGRHRGLSSRHAKLAVGSASTLVVFLVETHRERPPTN
jgi:hypothetical protein